MSKDHTSRKVHQDERRADSEGLVPEPVLEELPGRGVPLMGRAGRASFKDMD